MELMTTAITEIPRVTAESAITKELNDLEMALIGGGCTEATPY